MTLKNRFFFGFSWRGVW